jgi:chloramphenicol-sensitive protein RarD
VGVGRILEASLGYFMNPLVNVLLGVLFLHERLNRRQSAAVALAGAGVLAMVVRVGTVPWISLLLAVTFGLYGLVRKKARIDPMLGLLLETALMAPAAAAFLGWRAAEGTGALGSEPGLTFLLLLAGVITAVPLVWFTHGVQRLRYSTLGLVQYLAPTLQFLIAVALYREPFTRAHALAFGCIWLSLAVYSGDALAEQRRLARQGVAATHQPLPE